MNTSCIRQCYPNQNQLGSTNSKKISPFLIFFSQHFLFSKNTCKIRWDDVKPNYCKYAPIFSYNKNVTPRKKFMKTNRTTGRGGKTFTKK